MDLGAANLEQRARLRYGTRVKEDVDKRIRHPGKGREMRAANLAQNIPSGGRPIININPMNAEI